MSNIVSTRIKLDKLIISAVKCGRPTATRNHLNEFEALFGKLTDGLTSDDVLAKEDQFKAMYPDNIHWLNTDAGKIKWVNQIKYYQKYRVRKILENWDNSIKYVHPRLRSKSLAVLDVLRSHGIYINILADISKYKIVNCNPDLGELRLLYDVEDCGSCFPYARIFISDRLFSLDQFIKFMEYEVQASSNLDRIGITILGRLKDQRPNDTPNVQHRQKISWILPHIYAKTKLPEGALKAAINMSLMNLI